MMTCCGDYHYADCPCSDRYANEPDYYVERDYYDERDFLTDPNTCKHGDWDERLFQGHTWRRVEPGTVECEHCSVRAVEGQPDPNRAPCLVWRLERTCALCESDLEIPDYDSVLRSRLSGYV